MSRIVCVDSTILVWGVKRMASPGQQPMIQMGVRFIEWLENEGDRILIPTPVLTELLSHRVTESERLSVMSILQSKNFLVKPFDVACALKCSELLQKTFTEPELVQYTQQHQIPKQKIKFDAQIVATAIVNQCQCIYAQDGDLSRYADGQITVMPMPIIQATPTQLPLYPPQQ